MFAAIKHRKNKAFTLVELSIVIVIIGLIIGGVTAGMSLVRQAKIRDILNINQQVNTAFNTFKLQYNYLPGDMPNATSYWPTTRDGNNNRCLYYADTNSEAIFAWEHLNLSGIYKTSLTANSGNVFLPGVNVPQTNISEVYYGIICVNQNWTAGYAGRVLDGNFLVFGRKPPAHPNNHPWYGGFTAAEAYNADIKIDDGKPGMGIVLIHVDHTSTGDCLVDATETSPTNATYKINFTTPECHMMFRLTK